MKNSENSDFISSFIKKWADFYLFTKKNWESGEFVNWANFRKYDIVINSILGASYFFKTLLIFCLICFLTSFSFLTFFAYQISTEAVAAEGGAFREALIGDKLQRFNPVLPSNQNEKKVIKLLYHPLYKINYPNFLENPNSKTEIEPILLSKIPEWEPDKNNPQNNFYSLKFSLKPNLKWSDGSILDNKDVLFTFGLLSQEGANPEFKNIFKDYILENLPNSNTDFRILPRPGINTSLDLIYLAGFSPISKNFYLTSKDNLTIQNLLTDNRSIRPNVTSGYFFIPEKTKDLSQKNSQFQNNPIWDNKNITYNKIFLNANKQKNNDKKSLLEQYIFDLYNDLEDSGGVNQDSLEKNSKSGNVDLFTRFLDNNSQKSSEIKQILGLNQKTQLTNIYLNLYLNIQSSNSNFDGYFINQTLRKYTLCKINQINLEPDLENSLEIIKAEKRLIPIYFGLEEKLNCDNIESDLENYKNETGRQVYKINKNQESNTNKLLVFNREINLKILALNDFKQITEKIQDLLKKAGIPSEIEFISSSNLESKLKEKSYHIAFVPNNIVSNNPYFIYGQNGQNISNISQNTRVNGQNVEEKLKNYQNPDSKKPQLKSELTDFFKNQFVSLNLFRLKKEINYSNKIKESSFKGEDFSLDLLETYETLPTWYVNTKRRFRWR
jgi:hypothetical protein